MGKRQESRDRIEAQIVELARGQLETAGAGGLSLRAIARDLGMVSSAVYRYVASRDELLTLLLVDAYSSLAEHVDSARADGDWRDQLLAMARAAREWALERPALWALLYGSPVPGYHAPRERTVGPGTRVVAALLDVVSAGIVAGDIRSSKATAPQPLSSDYERLREEFGFTGDDAAVTRSLLLWAGLIGAISLEVFGQYGPDTLTEPAMLFDRQIGLLTDTLINP
ncbi:TetR/AcrR family transcriptional regulator [Mycolicibacterium flavescens]|uniref:TetR family transcriptional regulator n=1 Tax=Mycolicibacterium flavescens TaxID=1776 RepID=A0A1E3RBI7_MYCFV|nr:TetR/AcrR family transcriptional regulator [Mycolicibacterium flavescens]MCV7279115.1 TetR/AcrR family transcriptional regulator [Mycolicibacterium flavescens]ODQ86752.1 TetR family transcriptional regulator [Mycolicibacterium flavescens]